MFDKKYKEIAEELGLSKKLVEEVCKSQFKFVRKKIEEPEDHSIRLQYFGSFHIRPGRRNKNGKSETKEQSTKS